jgi:hypothetical protein
LYFARYYENDREWTEYVSCMGDEGNTYTLLAGKADRKSLVGKPMHSGSVVLKIYLEEQGWEGVGWQT